MHNNDIDGDGRSEFVVSSPWGLGVIGVNGTTMASKMLRPNGSRIGEWLLQTSENQFGPIAAFSAGRGMSVFVKSGWGIGLLRLDSPNGHSPVMASNGTRFGGWLLNTANDEFGPVADLDGDNKSELIVSSGWGMGVLKQSGNTFEALFMAKNGTKLGEWMLNTADNRFGPPGDYDGDGREELLVQSLWGIGVLKLTAAGLASAAMLPNGTSLGGWKLDVLRCRFLAVGNFAGGKIAHILAVDSTGVVVLKMSGSTFSLVARVRNGSFCGGWKLNTAGDRFGPGADFDGDGAAEIFVSSHWGIGVLKLSGDTLTSVAMAPNGSRLGDWVLNTRSDRLNHVGRFSGGPAAEILTSSGWGAGILKLAGQGFTSVSMAANQTKLGDWRLNTADNDLEHGHQRMHAVILYHHEWQSTVDHTVAALRRRGYTIHLSDDADTGLTMLRLLSLNLRAGDRMVVYLGGHGYADRRPGDFSQTTSDRHKILLSTGWLRLGVLAPIFASLGNRGVDLSVFDGSCEGGETVHRASGERYCAMATTALWSPACVNTPDPSGPVSMDTKPGKFGLWWDPVHLTASRINGQIMTEILAHGPHRLHQRLHRNDVSLLAKSALLVRTPICNLTLPGWNYVLEAWGCYLLKYIRTDLTATQQAALTTSLDDYLEQVNAIVAPQAVLLSEYKRLICDPGTIYQASFVYAANFDAAWRTLAGDEGWNVRGNPGKHRERMWQVMPDPFRPEEGFKRLANQALNTILLLERLFDQQVSLLRQMDTELQKRWRLEGVAFPKFKRKIQRKKTWESYLKQNHVDEEEARRLTLILLKSAVKRTPLIKLLERTPSMQAGGSMRLAPSVLSYVEDNHLALPLNFTDMDKVRQLAARVSSTYTEQYCHLARLNMLLCLVEDAIVAVHSRSAASPAELIYV